MNEAAITDIIPHLIVMMAYPDRIWANQEGRPTSVSPWKVGDLLDPVSQVRVFRLLDCVIYGTAYYDQSGVFARP